MSKNAPTTTPPVILVVDDQAFNLQVVGRTLGERGYEIKFARSAQEALDLAQADPPDLMLLDIMMPEMDGFELCERIKLNETLADIPVMFLTARNDDASIVRGFELGAVDFITKPFRVGELLARVQTHVRLKQATEELRRLNARKSEFLGIAAHDLKNPLMAIAGLAESVVEDLEPRKNDDPDAARHHDSLSNVIEAANHMLHVISEIMDTEALETGRISLQSEVLSLAVPAAHAISLNTSQAGRKQQEIVAELDPAVYAQVDSGRLLEVMDNLVSNAVKYSPNGRKIWITLKHHEGRNGRTARFSVRDQGPGLTEEDLKRVFERFARLSAKPTGGEASSGLGLSIVKQLVELMGGRVWVESRYLDGATFTIEFPAADGPMAEGNRK